MSLEEMTRPYREYLPCGTWRYLTEEEVRALKNGASTLPSGQKTEA